MSNPVNTTISNGVCHIELNRPDHANSLNLELAQGLQHAAGIAEDPEVRSVLITGAGPRFCAGGDLASFAGKDDASELIHELAVTADDGIQRLERLQKPIVAAVQGSVAGAGLAIMLAADVIYAAPDTKFVFAYPSVGLTPDCGASKSLPAAMGLQRALAFALSGKPLDVAQAMGQGLVTAIAEEPRTDAQQLAETWAKAAGAALGATRALMRSANATPRSEIGRQEATMIAHRAGQPEAQSLMELFMQR